MSETMRPTQQPSTSLRPQRQAPAKGADSGQALGKAPAAPPTSAKKRDAFFDNAKYLAIVLVAMGHAWEPLRGDSRAAAALYITVYTFHMPAVHRHLRLLLA